MTASSNEVILWKPSYIPEYARTLIFKWLKINPKYKINVSRIWADFRRTDKLISDIVLLRLEIYYFDWLFVVKYSCP